MKILACVLLVLVLFLSCRSSKLDTPPETMTLFDRYWKLVEIDGGPVGATNKEPHMILRSEENGVNGNGGCNSYFGKWEVTGNNGISFSAIGATKMACPNMEVESKFFQAFERARYYNIRGDTLSLNTERMSPIAKFVAADSK